MRAVQKSFQIGKIGSGQVWTFAVQALARFAQHELKPDLTNAKTAQLVKTDLTIVYTCMVYSGE